MKIVAINGSRRKHGNTSILIESLLAPAISRGIQTETLFLGDFNIDACTGCEACSRSWDCVIDDDFAAVVEKLDAADGVILASPTYWYSVTSDMKRFIDRCYSLIQFPKNRKEWIGKYHGAGKVGITVAICEQSDELMMGETLTLLTAFSKDIGIEVVASLKGLNYFEAGSISKDPDFLQQAKHAGEKFLSHLLQ